MGSQSDGQARIGVLRMFEPVVHGQPDWLYTDLYLAEEAQAAVTKIADEYGIAYDIFLPRVVPKDYWYNDLQSGADYVHRMGKYYVRDSAAPDKSDRTALPSPKGWVA